MKPSDRQKMCPNCDGRIPFDAAQCPYCFTMVPQEGSHSSQKISSTQENLTSLYPPAYAAKPAREEKRAPSAAQEQVAALSSQEVGNTADSQQFWPILALSLGGNLFTIGVLQFFFSEQGVVNLELNSGYWFLLVLASVPLFYFGFKKLEGK